MIKLSENDKLKITRIGRGQHLLDVAKELHVSFTYVSKMENSAKPVMKEANLILNFDNGIDWYVTIVNALNGRLPTKSKAEEVTQVLNKVIGLRR